MQIASQKITPCLWFDTEAEEAARFYCSVFKDSRLGKIQGFSADGFMVKYQDIIEAVDDDHWTLRSRMLGEDGKWVEFMTAHYRRARPLAA